MAKDFESIATLTGNGTAQTLSFTSIPGTYQHLQIRGVARTARAGVNNDGIFCYFNGDTNDDANYISHVFDGDGTSVTSGGAKNNGVYCRLTVITGANATSNIMGVFVCDILDYANTNKNKVTRTFGGNNRQTSGGDVRLASGLWINTNAITSITIWNNNNSAFTSDTRIALYGIKG